MQLLSALHLLSGDFELLTSTILVGETIHLHHQYVDERIKTGTRINGILNDHGLHTRRSVDALDGLLPISILGIELIDDSDHGLVELTSVTSLNLGTSLETLDSADHTQTNVSHLECREQTTAEVVRTRGVDDIELATHKLREQSGRIDRTFVFVLDVGIVREGILAFDSTTTVDYLTFVSHSLGHRGFTRAGGTDQNDVLDLLS